MHFFLHVLPQDLGAKDLKREQVYIVCQIVRVGQSLFLSLVDFSCFVIGCYCKTKHSFIFEDCRISAELVWSLNFLNFFRPNGYKGDGQQKTDS